MQWQDFIISGAQFCFVLALIPSIRGKDKPAASSSIMNVILVTVITVCLITLGLWFSAFTSFLVMLTWLVLAVQKMKIDRTI